MNMPRLDSDRCVAQKMMTIPALTDMCNRTQSIIATAELNQHMDMLEDVDRERVRRRVSKLPSCLHKHYRARILSDSVHDINYCQPSYIGNATQTGASHGP